VASNDQQRLSDLLLGSLAASPVLNGIVFIRNDLFTVTAAQNVGAMPYISSTAAHTRDPLFHDALSDAQMLPGAFWRMPFYNKQLGETELPLLNPLHKGESFLGVVAVSVSLRQLSELLAVHQMSGGGLPFVLTEDGYVIAHRGLAQGHFLLSDVRPMLRKDEVGDPILAAFAPQIRDPTTRPFPTSTDFSAQSLIVGGQGYVAIYRRLNGVGQSPWIVGVYYPQGAFTDTLNKVADALAAGLTVLMLAVGLAALIGWRLSQPMRRLAIAAERLSRFDVTEVEILPRSRFLEIDIVTSAYNSLRNGLTWLESYVPRQLVPVLLKSGDELQPQHREISILFTDIVNFSNFAHEFSAAQLADFLNGHFTLIAGAIEETGGIIDKYIGDSVMAFWGAPQLRPDHAERAACAARLIAERLTQDNKLRQLRGDTQVRIRVGMHSGPVLIGNIGAANRINYTLVGETVNLAQRIEQFGHHVDDGKKTATILASADLVAALKDSKLFRTLGPQLLDGHGDPIMLYEMLL